MDLKIKSLVLSCLALFCIVGCSPKEPVKINYNLQDDIIGYFYYNKVLYRIEGVKKNSDPLGKEITTIKRIVSELQEGGDLYYPKLYEGRKVEIGNKVYVLGENMDPRVALAIETDAGDYLVALIAVKNPEFIH